MCEWVKRVATALPSFSILEQRDAQGVTVGWEGPFLSLALHAPPALQLRGYLQGRKARRIQACSS